MTTEPDPDETELLLPWHVTGRLDPAEAARVESARDASLARRLDMARAERDAAVAVNRSLGAPSPAAREALFARIDADLAARARPSGGWLRRLGAALAGLSPPVLAGAALAACLVILAEAGLLTGFWLAQPPARYETASHGAAPERGPGTFALVAFAPTASAAQIAEALREAGASIVDGPRPGGVYRLRLSAGAMEPREAASALERLRARPGLILFAGPETAPAR